MWKILILHGPNLNLLGKREPDIYGNLSLDDIDKRLVIAGHELCMEVRAYQSYVEGVLIDQLHAAEAAIDMGMPLRTLREQRRKLDELGYISCVQLRHNQNIIIKRWVNPRDYGGKVLNTDDFEGDAAMEPLKDDGYIEGYTKGYIKGSSQDVTPTSNSESKSLNRDKEIFAALSELTGGGLNSETTRFVDGWKEQHSLEWILKAVSIAKEKGGRSVRYVDSILIGWEANGYPKSREQQVQERKAKQPVAASLESAFETIDRVLGVANG